MSAYCTTSDIEAEIKGITIDSSSIPTDTQVTEFIDQESARIDGYVGRRYDLPISGTESLKVLKRICIALVTWRVSDIISTRKVSQLPNGMISQDLAGATAYKQAVKDLERISNGDMKLPDETASNSSSGSGYFASQNLEDDRQPAFDMSVDQW